MIFVRCGWACPSLLKVHSNQALPHRVHAVPVYPDDLPGNGADDPVRVELSLNWYPLWRTLSQPSHWTLNFEQNFTSFLPLDKLPDFCKPTMSRHQWVWAYLLPSVYLSFWWRNVREEKTIFLIVRRANILLLIMILLSRWWMAWAYCTTSLNWSSKNGHIADILLSTI